MAVVYTMQTPFITQGNTQVRYTITAETSGNDLIWKAAPNGAKVLCYGERHHYSYGTYTEYFTYGSNTLYFRIKIKPKNGSATTSSQKVALGTVSARTSMSGDGWQGWTPTSEVVSLTATGVYTDYDVYIISSGAGQADQETQILWATTDGGSTPTPPTPPTPTPTPTGVSGISVKINGSWKPVSAMYVKVNGSWKSVNAIYVKVNGSWKLASS